MISVNIDNILNFVSKEKIKSYEVSINKHYDDLCNKTGKGNDFLGWVSLPEEITKEQLNIIKDQAKKIKKIADIYVVIGIGGSYLGTRSVIEALDHNFNSLLPKGKRENPLVLYAGQNISSDYINDLMEILDDHDYAIAVISKSGTTTEPAIAFRLLKNHLEKKYGKENAKERITAITDKERGALKVLADKEGYTSYVIPDDVGGRYSVLTPVGLLPIAVAGFDIDKLVEGASDMCRHIRSTKNIFENPAALYAAARNALYEDEKSTEILVNYLPGLMYFTEWWKQLYGESEGKDGKGIFPAGVNFTTDLHSMGQYIQDGKRNIFETILSVENSPKHICIPDDKDDLDGLNYIAGKELQYVNRMAEKGTLQAHLDGGVPNIIINIPQINETTLGELIYFFEIACGISGYILGVNPFNQPGVEDYKRNMFALLGK